MPSPESEVSDTQRRFFLQESQSPIPESGMEYFAWQTYGTGNPVGAKNLIRML
jgi:hypothetical protein